MSKAPKCAQCGKSMWLYVKDGASVWRCAEGHEVAQLVEG